MNIAKIDDNYQLDEIKKEIDKSVVELTDKLKKHNPMELIYHIKSMEMIPTVSENDPGVMLFKTDNEYAIMIEYFISLLTCITFDQFGNENIENGDINEIINAYHHIQTEIYQYLILTINTPEYKEKHTDDETDYIINRFLFSNVRGKRYRCFERDYYNVLLLPHEKEIERIYQININDFYDGMFQIMDISLGSFLDAMNILDDVFEKYDNPEDVPFEIRKEFSKSLTIEQYKIDPTKIWNKEMLDDFSLSFGGNSLFDNGKYARWPINNSLLKQKPIIKVENDYFCFNYYNLADNFYRMLYKNLIHNDKKYAQKWQEIQKFSTENYVSKLFKMIFNDAKIYNDNYYFPNGVKRERSENDILVIFDDVLFIVEVKAGNFTPDNSLVGYESHKKTIKALVEEPDRQCMEIYEYLQNNKKIYDENNLEKVEIELDKFDEVYMISITLENFNEIASIIEKFENIKFTKGNILISIDDFRIYADYFENNPYLFLDYLKYRKKAMEFIELNVTDELDHLGLYIDYHNYIYEIKSQIKNQQNQEFNIVYVDDAKNDLDLYYDSKQTPEIIGKPLPLWIDDNYKKLLLLIQKKKCEYKHELINSLLDILNMDVNFFTSLLNRILLGKHLDDLAISSVTINEAEINFVYIIGKNTKDKYNKVRLRCLAKLKRNNLKKCFVIYLDVNKKMKLKGIQLDCIYDYEIKSRNQKQLEDLSEKYYLIRKKSMLRNLNLRELPDDILCPCGSGKKYILCCKAKEKQK